MPDEDLPPGLPDRFYKAPPAKSTPSPTPTPTVPAAATPPSRQNDPDAYEAYKRAHPPAPTTSLTDKEVFAALRDAKPSWMTDGKGIRGDVVVVSNSKADLNWKSVPAFRRANLDVDDQPEASSTG